MKNNDQGKNVEPTIEVDGKKYTLSEYRKLEEEELEKKKRSMRAKGLKPSN